MLPLSPRLGQRPLVAPEASVKASRGPGFSLFPKVLESQEDPPLRGLGRGVRSQPQYVCWGLWVGNRPPPHTVHSPENSTPSKAK